MVELGDEAVLVPAVVILIEGARGSGKVRGLRDPCDIGVPFLVQGDIPGPVGLAPSHDAGVDKACSGGIEFEDEAVVAAVLHLAHACCGKIRGIRFPGDVDVIVWVNGEPETVVAPVASYEAAVEQLGTIWTQLCHEDP